MTIYELRTYTLQVGKMSEAQKLYQDKGWPALEPFRDKLISYFIGDIGAMNQIVHLWKFDDDADRRVHWDAVFASDDFMAFAKEFRPLILTQENKLLTSAPWGPSV